jgi:hypothetical protein
MAYEKESHDRIAALLDDAEIVAIKMAHSREHAGEVRELLKVLIDHFPELADVLAIFDGTATNPPWRGW